MWHWTYWLYAKYIEKDFTFVVSSNQFHFQLSFHYFIWCHICETGQWEHKKKKNRQNFTLFYNQNSYHKWRLLVLPKQEQWFYQTSTKNKSHWSYQLLTLVNEIHVSFDSRNSIEVWFFLTSKAINKVCREGRLFKLKQNGVAGNPINLLINYLSGRRQRVVINGTSCEFFQVESGVLRALSLVPCFSSSMLMT